MLAMEFSIEPPHLAWLVASSSRLMPGCVESPSTPKGMSRLLHTAEAWEAWWGEAQTAPGYLRYHVPSSLAWCYHHQGWMLRNTPGQITLLNNWCKMHVCANIPASQLSRLDCRQHYDLYMLVEVHRLTHPALLMQQAIQGWRLLLVIVIVNGEQDIVSWQGCRCGQRSLHWEVLARADKADMMISLFNHFRMVVIALVVLQRNQAGNMVCESRRIDSSGDPSNANKWNLYLSMVSRKICYDWYISWRW